MTRRAANEQSAEASSMKAAHRGFVIRRGAYQGINSPIW